MALHLTEAVGQRRYATLRPPLTPTMTAKAREPQPFALRRMGPLLVVLAAVFVVPLLLPFPLTDPDEGLHAQIAREMVDSGDWITPRFLGEPFYDKPILFFWGTAGSLAVFGSSEWAARLPAVLFGLVGVMGTWALGHAIFRSTAAAFTAVLILATTIHYVVQSQVVVHDIALTACVTATMLCLWKWDACLRRGRRRGWLIAAGAMMGLACLAKGLLGLALPTLIFGIYLLVTRRLTIHTSVALVSAGALGVLVAVPWYVLMERANPGYLRYFLWERHVMGFLANEQRHGDEPIWYYVPVLLIGGWPWIGYLPAALRTMWHRRQTVTVPASGVREPAPLAFMLVWIGTVFGFFSLAGSKLHTYVLPLYPAVALLLAHAWHRQIAGAVDAFERIIWSRAHTLVCWISAIAAPVAATVAFAWAGSRLSLVTWIGVGSASLLALCSWRLGQVGRRSAALYVLGGAMGGAFAVIVALLMPIMAASKSHKELARVLRSATPRTDTVLWWRDRIGSAAFYGVGARIERLESLDELTRKIAQRPVRLAVRRRIASGIERIVPLDGTPYCDVQEYRVYYLQ